MVGVVLDFFLGVVVVVCDLSSDLSFVLVLSVTVFSRGLSRCGVA